MSKKAKTFENTVFEQSLLGHRVNHYAEEYDPALLCPIARNESRHNLGLKKFDGVDVWRMYEITCLNAKGLPMALAAVAIIPACSEYIVESKSLKLYLMSLTQTKFANPDQVSQVIKADLSKVCQADVEVLVCLRSKLHQETYLTPTQAPGLNLDDEILNDPACELKSYVYDPALLKAAPKLRSQELLHSFALRTICPVTAQPDYGTLIIRYRGNSIDHHSLFAYIASLRHHKGFHENCVELIYSDLKTQLNPDELTVSAHFTRRGGIDISPVRGSSFEDFAKLRIQGQ